MMHKIELPKKMPEDQDYAKAEREFTQDNPSMAWSELPTRKRNMLAKDQMYYREYLDLCRAITRK